MIVKGKNRDYVYEYKYVYLHNKEHAELMKLSKTHKLSASRMIIKLIKHYENTKTEEIGTSKKEG